MQFGLRFNLIQMDQIQDFILFCFICIVFCQRLHFQSEQYQRSAQERQLLQIKQRFCSISCNLSMSKLQCICIQFYRRSLQFTFVEHVYIASFLMLKYKQRVKGSFKRILIQFNSFFLCMNLNQFSACKIFGELYCNQNQKKQQIRFFHTLYHFPCTFGFSTIQFVSRYSLIG
ncbi:transmembrane protein, putative (macronuclear) [Tetrahymena thermophila SB210]|uniref:Transmembrane protein, putative n=1 Tax=Tetrahymena thermophila (strain SB210) TaxID=312017 RepID=W7XBS1_TETTS|nr:transmembrane protein, putative [Tetrahymena thermophila SB210]EWS71131.1 transmembrane protein, putative [Tetrahymena thermophila SB210]|eukprot:XP_012656339.1 transmembrane protein, putative [Tetrahymena thermophila SB210]